MTILGIILLLLGIVLAVPVLKTLGILLLIVAVVLWLIAAAGGTVAGRRYWF